MEKIKELEHLARTLDQDEHERLLITKIADNYTNEFLNGLSDMPGYTTGSFEKLNSLKFSNEGKLLEVLIDVLKCEVDATGINTASGKHMGFIPGGGLWTSSIADKLAATSNRYAGIAYSNPGAVKIEKQVIDWMVSLVEYPSNAYGNLTSGGSTANLMAIKAARDHHQINSMNVRQAVIYITSQTHHCVNKALHITGLYESVQRTIEINAKFQMDTNALRTQIRKDISEGLKPFLVIGSAGTTDTGSVDDMDAIAAISDEFDLWFHVDAAYGGFFMLLEEFKIKFKGIERSDSVVLDPHKSLFIPYGSGAVLVRDRNILLASNVYKAAYMKDAFEMEDINPADTGIELTRHNRALRMWLPLHLHGLAPFKAALQEKLILSNYFHQKISSLGFETGHQPDLTVSIFRFPHDEDNKINQALVDAIHKDGRVFLSSTFIHGKLWIRCAILSHRTHLDEVNLALKMIEENITNLKK